MKSIWDLLQECHIRGATLMAIDDKIKIQASKPLPENLTMALKESKEKVLIELKRRDQSASKCWVLAEWRRLSLPEWRRVLNHSIETRNKCREEYARWMLKEVLEDQEYIEEVKND